MCVSVFDFTRYKKNTRILLSVSVLWLKPKMRKKTAAFLKEKDVCYKCYMLPVLMIASLLPYTCIVGVCTLVFSCQSCDSLPLTKPEKSSANDTSRRISEMYTIFGWELLKIQKTF